MTSKVTFNLRFGISDPKNLGYIIGLLVNLGTCRRNLSVHAAAKNTHLESQFRRAERHMPWKPRQRKDGPISREGTNEEKISVVRAFEVPTLTRLAEMENYSEAKATDRTSTGYHFFLTYKFQMVS